MSSDHVAESTGADEPIVATIVPAARAPWQFGLKALLGLMAVCSVQFALMSYLTVIGGLLAAVLLCGIALAVILIAAVIFVPSRSMLMERLDYFGIRLVVGIAILLVGTILAGGGTAIVYTVGEMRTAMNLEHKIGFRTLRTEVWDNKGTRQALRIVVVYAGSDAEQAGLRAGEVILLDGTVNQFYQQLQENRGKPFSFNVAGNPIGGSIEKVPQRQATIIVPK